MQGMNKRSKQAKVEQTIAPAVHQVWEDCDARVSRSRQVKIHSIDLARQKARCVVQTVPNTGRVTWIGLHRFRPTSTGYRYVRTDPV